MVSDVIVFVLNHFCPKKSVEEWPGLVEGDVHLKSSCLSQPPDFVDQKPSDKLSKQQPRPFLLQVKALLGPSAWATVPWRRFFSFCFFFLNLNFVFERFPIKLIIRDVKNI